MVSPIPMLVPHPTTALSGPILDLEQRILDAMPVIEHWLRKQWRDHIVPFYCSVDLRNSGFKLAPVDTNLFPGGFNNLSQDFMPSCVQAMLAAVEKICPDARTVLLIPENHTRNVFLSATHRDVANHHAARRNERSHRHPAAGNHRCDHDRSPRRR